MFKEAHNILNTLDSETKVIFSLINEDASAIDDINLKRMDWVNLLMRASANKVLYLFVSRVLNTPVIKGQLPQDIIKLLNVIMSRGDVELRKLKNTLEFINSIFHQNSIPILLIKTYKGFPYVTYDADILVNPSDFKTAQIILESKNDVFKSSLTETPTKFRPSYLFRSVKNNLHHVLYKYLTIPTKGKSQDEGEVHIIPSVPHLLTIDLHHDFLVHGARYIDYDLLWENPRMVEISGVNCSIPNLEAETLINIAHTIHENMFISLLNFIFIKENCEKIDWNLCLAQSKKYGWLKSFLRFASLIDVLNSRLCPQKSISLINIPQINKPKAYMVTPLGMPYFYSVPYMVEAFLEHIRVTSVIPLFDILYYFFAKLRYHCTGKKCIPIYHHWLWWH
jgi:hypothetical protein